MTEALFETKLFYTTPQPWYVMTKNLNSSWWNYFYSFFVSNFFGVLFNQDVLTVFSNLYETRWSYYCRFDLITPALLVGYNNIHPPFFYVFLWAVLSLGLEERFGTARGLFCLGAVIFYWGSLWGVGNAAWGYFWVKDAIEMMLFTALVLLILFLHWPPSSMSFLRLCTCWFLIGVTLLLLRWGLIFTRHSFFNLLSTVNFAKFYTLLCFNWSLGALPVIFSYYQVASFFMMFCYLFSLVLIFLLSRTQFMRHIYFHTTLFVCVLSWLKYQPHNYTQFWPLFKFNSFFYGLGATAACDFANLLMLSIRSVKAFAIYASHNIYGLKSLLLDLNVYINWPRFFVLIIILISIKKIYV